MSERQSERERRRSGEKEEEESERWAQVKLSEGGWDGGRARGRAHSTNGWSYANPHLAKSESGMPESTAEERRRERASVARREREKNSMEEEERRRGECLSRSNRL